MNRDDDIGGILITNREREERQSDSIRTESMLGLVVIAVIAIAVTAYLVYRYWQSSVMMLALVGAN